MFQNKVFPEITSWTMFWLVSTFSIVTKLSGNMLTLQDMDHGQKRSNLHFPTPVNRWLMSTILSSPWKKEKKSDYIPNCETRGALKWTVTLKDTWILLFYLDKSEDSWTDWSKFLDAKAFGEAKVKTVEGSIIRENEVSLNWSTLITLKDVISE